MAIEIASVALDASPIARYRGLIDDDLWAEFERAMRVAGAAADGRVVWNINSTIQGGGVAELLEALLPYQRSAGIDARWVAIEGTPAFFGFTKRLHTLLHGVSPDGTEISAAERSIYESRLAENATALLDKIRPEDIVILHDPQTAGLAPALSRHGCPVIWRCHIGVDQPSEMVRRAWSFLTRYLSAVRGLIFTRRAYVWDGLDPARVQIIPPSIDAFTLKNQDLDEDVVSSILHVAGLVDSASKSPAATFMRRDGSTGQVSRRAEVLEMAKLSDGDRIVLQVSRWDRLKDPVGFLNGFAQHVDAGAGAHLVLAGPSITGVADDPEQPEVMHEDRWKGLDPASRARVHIAQLPMDDADENAVLVNALQRRADVVVQKSIAEGFGLTVGEAMWKRRAVVASRVGGIEDQIEDEKSGLLIDDPHDLAAFGQAVGCLLKDPAARRAIGYEARRRVGQKFLAPTELTQHADLIRRVTARAAIE